MIDTLKMKVANQMWAFSGPVKFLQCNMLLKLLEGTQFG